MLDRVAELGLVKPEKLPEKVPLRLTPDSLFVMAVPGNTDEASVPLICPAWMVPTRLLAAFAKTA